MKVLPEKKSSAVVLSFTVLFVLYSTADAGTNLFDNNRQGLVFNMSLGGGMSSISSKNSGLTGDITKGTVGFIYRLGYAPNDRWVLYASYKSSIYASKIGEHYESLAESIDSNKVSGYIGAALVMPFIFIFTDQNLLMGLGTSYYFRRSIPSWFIDFSAGGAITSDPYEAEGASSFPGGMHGGYGLSVGGGYEFARHFQAELQLMWSQAAWETSSGEKSWSTISILLVIGVIGY